MPADNARATSEPTVRNSGAQKPLVSVVIIVKADRSIVELLSRLRRMPKPGATETIVVDGSPNDELHDLAVAFPEVRWLRRPAPTGISTIPEQRNMGVRAAEGDIVVFIDADCVPDDEWLERITEPIQLRGEDIVAGGVRIGGYMAMRAVRPGYVRYAGNGNLAIARRVLESIGGYDESFDLAEDYDFCFRARTNGFQIMHHPAASVEHPNDSFRKNMRKSYRYGAAAVRLYRRHPAEATPSNPHVQFTVLYGLLVAALPFGVVRRLRPFAVTGVLLLSVTRSPRKQLMNLSFGAGAVSELLRLVVTFGGRPT